MSGENETRIVVVGRSRLHPLPLKKEFVFHSKVSHPFYICTPPVMKTLSIASEEGNETDDECDALRLLLSFSPYY